MNDYDNYFHKYYAPFLLSNICGDLYSGTECQSDSLSPTDSESTQSHNMPIRARIANT